MSYEINGTIEQIFDTKEISATFKKREFILKKTEMSNDREFTDFIKFQLIQDKCGLVDSYNAGDEVKVSFNIKGNRWERDGNVNYFTNLDCWKIERLSSSGGNDASYSQDMPKMPEPPPETPEELDDLPF